MPRTEVDPCPKCGVVPEGWTDQSETVRSNPSAVLPGIGGGPAIINPAPDPGQDRITVVNVWTTFEPCGHTFSSRQLDAAGWQRRVIYTRPDLPEMVTVEELRRLLGEVPPGTRLRVAYVEADRG